MDDLGWLFLEPYNRTEDQVARMTDAQIVSLYGRERDEKTGAVKPVGVEKKRDYMDPEAAKAEFTHIMRMFGNKSDAEIEAAWERGRTKGV